MYRGMTLALLVLIAGTAMASERGTRVDVEEQFAAQRVQILEELGDGETYSEIKEADREKVKAALARISTALAQSGGIERARAAALIPSAIVLYDYLWCAGGAEERRELAEAGG